MYAGLSLIDPEHNALSSSVCEAEHRDTAQNKHVNSI